ncbi:MAG: hypothetical protein OYG31_00830 [Candidatus Kaiserbacteria bacterium]|nr:hypothetical protein [Candidatus Kaiserbacteria bacterium]
MKRTLRTGISVAVFIFLSFVALTSFLSLKDSFASYRQSRKYANHALLERSYVEQQLLDVQMISARQGYDIERVEVLEQTSLNRIDLRGVSLNPGENRPFSPNEVDFTVLEQETGRF